MATAGSIVVDLLARTGSFITDVDRAQKKLSGFGADVQKVSAMLDKAAIAVAGVAAGSVTALAAMATKTAQAANEIRNFSALAGASTTEFQRMAVAAESVGIGQEKLADQLKDFQEKAGEFVRTGGGGMKDFFEQVAPKIGLTAGAFRNLSGPQGLQLYYNSLEKAGLNQQQMSFYLESMASDTTALIPILRNGGEELDRLADRAQRFGVILSEDAINQAATLQRSLDDMSRVSQGAGRQIGMSLVPAMQRASEYGLAMAESMMEVTDGASALDRFSQSTVRFVDDIGQGAAGVSELGRVVGEVISSIDEVATNWVEPFRNGVLGATATLQQSFTDSVLATAREIDKLVGFAGGVSEVWSAVGQNIPAFFELAWGRVLINAAGFVNNLAGIVNPMLESLGMEGFSGVDWGKDVAVGIESLSEAFSRGSREATESVGAYARVQSAIAGIRQSASEAAGALGGGSGPTVPGAGLSGGLSNTGKRLTEAQKAAAAFRKEQERSLAAQYQSVSAIHDQAQGLEDQLALYGLSATAIEDLTIARLEERAVILSMYGDNAQPAIEAINAEIEARKRLRAAIGGQEQKEAEKAAWESWARSVDGVFSRVQQSLTDAIFDGAKDGRELVEDLFRTLTVDLLINPVMRGFQDQVTASMGGIFGYQNEQQQKSSSFDFNQFMGGGTGNMLSSAGNYIGSTMVAEFGAGLTAGAGGALTDASASALMNIGTNGSSSFAAGSSIGGIGLGSIAGYGSALVNLAEGNYGSAAGAAIGTYIMPGIGTAVGSLLGGFADDMFGGGPPRTRHGQRSTSEWIDGRIQLTGMDSRQSSESQVAAAQAAQAAVTQANALFTQLGIDAAFDSFYAIMESSVLGDRQGVASGGTLRIGDQLRQVGVPQASDMTLGGFGGWSEADMLPRLATDVQLTVLEAFQQLGDTLPPALSGMLKDVSIRALDEAGAQQLAQRFTGLITAVSQFQEAVIALPFDQLRGLSFDAAAGLIDVAGGLEALSGNLSTYYNEFYTEAERNANTLRNVAKALEEVGVALPDTRDQFRALVEAQDLTTDAGRRVYAALLNVSGAFASVTQSAEQAAQEQQRIAQERRDSVIRDLESAYSAVVSAGQAEIARLQQSFGATDSAMNAYRSKVQALESQLESMFSSIGRYVSDLRGNVEASAQAQYRQARAVISTALATGQLPQTADLTEALQVAQRGVTSQVYGSLFEQNRAYAILANEMEALKGIAEPELDAARATLAQLEEQYALLRGTNRIAGDSLSALEQQVRLAFATEEVARHEISLVEQQLELAKQQHEQLMEVLTGIDGGIKSLAEAMAAYAAAAAAAKQAVSGGGGGTGGWTPGNLPAGAENLSAAQQYVLYNNDLLQEQARSGMSVEQYAQFHWNTYGKYEDRTIGLNSYAVGTDFVPHDMTANIHRGEIIINPRDSDILRNYGIRVQAQGGDSREVVSELRALREQNARLERRLASIEQSTGQLADQFDNVTAGGNAMATEEMA